MLANNCRGKFASWWYVHCIDVAIDLLRAKLVIRSQFRTERRLNMRTTRFLAVLILSWVAGCTSEDTGFTLPAGDAERGQSAFVKFRCFDCHRVPGVDLPTAEEPDQVLVTLGGEVERAKSYADLVTGIVNPSHRLAKGYAASTVAFDGKSRMTVYNDVMTIAELTDIVTYLQQHYEVRPYEPTPYPDYYMP
jgi:hypothetical protein